MDSRSSRNAKVTALALACVALLVAAASWLYMTTSPRALLAETIETLETHHVSGSAWTTYIPLDWRKTYQAANEYPHVSSIVITPDNAAWFATDGGPVAVGVGVYRFDGKIWRHFRKGIGLPFDEFSSMTVAQDGTLWLGSYGGAVQFDGKNSTIYTTANGLPSNDIRSIALAPDGALWVGTADHGAARFDGASWRSYTTRDGLWGDFVGRLVGLPGGSLLASSSTGSSAKLSRFDGQGWVDFPTPWTGAGNYVEDVAALPNGELWLATEHAGVFRFAQNAWQSYSEQTGLPSDIVLCAAVTRDGALWIGTSAGLARFDGEGWTTFNSGDGVGVNWVTACAAAPDGSLWVGYTGGIAHYVPADTP